MPLRLPFLLTILSCMLISAPAARGESCPVTLLVVEEDGRVSSGSKQNLHSAVQMGFPLRVGVAMDVGPDGKAALSHWADAVFITEFEGEIFTQLIEIRRQTPKGGEKHVELSPTSSRWTGSVGTDGILEGAFDDDHKPFRMRVRTTWCIDPRVPLSNVPASIRHPQRDKPSKAK